jgi:hypothetical protein
LHLKLPQVFVYSTLLLVLTISFRAAIITDAESTRVFLDPPTQTVGAVGDHFFVNVSISDVSNLYGYELKIYYNSTIMNGTSATEGSFLRGGGPTFWDLANFTDDYNSTEGVLYVADLLTAQVSGVSGGGVLARIEFKSVALGNCVLHLEDVELSDPTSSQISHADSDGAVTVVPELTPTGAFLIVIITSLFGILIGKRAMRKPVISALG